MKTTQTFFGLTAPPEMGEDAIRNLKAQLDELRTGVGK
jgi:hypothetical protein